MSEPTQSQAYLLDLEVEAAENAEITLRRKINNAVNAAISQLEQAVHIEGERVRQTFADVLRNAVDRVQQATDARDAARIEEAPSKAKYQVGTIMCEWVPTYGTRNYYKATGKRGVVQVYHPGDSVAATKDKYSRPALGSVVIRPLKKDGTTGVDCFDMNKRHHGHWLPEGEKPKGAA